jgi:hypothetical protein
MKIYIASMTFSALIFLCTSTSALDLKPNGSSISEIQYSIKTSKGTRKYQKINYNGISQPIKFPITNHQNSALGSRGTRFDFNSLPPTSSGSTAV